MEELQAPEMSAVGEDDGFKWEPCSQAIAEAHPTVSQVTWSFRAVWLRVDRPDLKEQIRISTSEEWDDREYRTIVGRADPPKTTPSPGPVGAESITLDAEGEWVIIQFADGRQRRLSAYEI